MARGIINVFIVRISGKINIGTIAGNDPAGADREAVDDRAVNCSKLSVYTVNVSARPAHINPVTSHEASFWHAFDKAAVFCHGQ